MAAGARGVFNAAYEPLLFDVERLPFPHGDGKETLAALEQLAPFGMDNRLPLFAVQGAELVGAPRVWKDKHLKVAVKQGTRTVTMKAWNMAERAEEIAGMGPMDIAFEIERGWLGGWELTAREFRAH